MKTAKTLTPADALDAGFEIKRLPEGYYWAARFWVEDSRLFETLDECLASLREEISKSSD